MKTLRIYLFITVIMISMIPLLSFAQRSSDIIQMEGDKMVIKLDRRDQPQCGELIKYFGLNEDSLFNHRSIGALSKDGWNLKSVDKNVALIEKKIDASPAAINWGQQPIYFEGGSHVPGSPGYPGHVKFGVNNFKAAPSVYENKNDETVFVLRGYQKSQNVFLSGNFNDWSTNAAPMRRTDSGWVATLHLRKEEYLYKFIVDGKWISDPGNNQHEGDGYGNNNSVYFHHNYTFRLKGYTNAKKVIVAGSFNDWNEKQLQMQRTPDGWALNLYLSKGTHAYKFIIDGTWLLDPANKTAHPDGQGNVNSYLSIGDTTVFTLKGFTDARIVVLSGDFNAWNGGELPMSRSADGWKIPYVLAPGNYEYKFVVDGKWITDPANPILTGDPDHRNSFIAIQPNYTFTLKNFPDAKKVSLSGSFNGWADPGHPMTKKNGVWQLPLYLPAGKYTYKLVVDGKWILDPDNKLMEENEYSTGNSVLWIGPEQEFMER